MSDERVSSAQVPPPGELALDHVAHFVPDMDGASLALERLGYALTPFSPQSHRLTEDGPLVPAGTGNRCVMLERGYLEFLTPTADTPLAAQLRVAIDRYVGVHLIAFGTGAPERDYERLEREGYRPLPAVALQRPVDTSDGSDTARFTVVRVAPGTMAEGRIQYCEHHTPQLLWQPRWIQHRNTVVALTGVVLCVEDVREAAERYSRYTGLPAQATEHGWRIATRRGDVHCISAQAAREHWRVEPRALPWIAGPVLAARDLDVLATYVQNAGCPAWPMKEGLRAQLPPELGGLALFHRAEAAPLSALQ